MTAAPLKLPRMTGGEARASRLSSVPRSALTLPGTGLRLSVDAAGEGRRGPALIRVGVRWGRHRYAVQCDAGAVEAVLCRPDLGLAGLGLADLAPDAAALALEASLLDAVTALERASGAAVEVTDLAPDAGFGLDVGLDAGGGGAAGVALWLDDGARRWSLWVSAPPDAERGRADLLSAWPATAMSLAHLPLPAAMRVGTTRLPLGVARSLRPGDAVLLETARSGGSMLVVADAWLAEARPHQDGHRLERGLRRARAQADLEWTAKEDEEVDENSDDGADAVEDADDLPIRLAFDVGRTEIPLGELRRLGVGAVLSLGRDVDDLVRIRANGRLIGHGTLVDVEGVVGVRVVRMFEHG